MKFKSSIDRIVGKVPEQEKKEIADEMGERFEQQYFVKKLPENLKAPEAIRVLELTDQETNKVLEKYGITPYTVPAKNVYIVPSLGSHGTGEVHGDYSPERQAIRIVSQPDASSFFVRAFHEMIHLKSYNAMQVVENKDNALESYRVGLGTNSRDGKKKFFRPLNEAVTEELTKRYTRESLESHPCFQKDRALLRGALRGKEGTRGSEVFTVHVEEIGASRDASGKNEYAVVTKEYSYQDERAVLKELCQKIAARASDTYTNDDEVFELFAKSLFTGDLLRLGRTIEKLFGKGTFRRLAEAQDANALREVVSSL